MSKWSHFGTKITRKCHILMSAREKFQFSAWIFLKLDQVSKVTFSMELLWQIGWSDEKMSFTKVVVNTFKFYIALKNRKSDHRCAPGGSIRKIKYKHYVAHTRRPSRVRNTSKALPAWGCQMQVPAESSPGPAPATLPRQGLSTQIGLVFIMIWRFWSNFLQ